MPTPKKPLLKEKILKSLVGENSEVITKSIEKNNLRISEVFEFLLNLNIAQRLPFCLAVLGLDLPDKKDFLETENYWKVVNNSINYALKLGDLNTAVALTNHFFDYVTENIYIAHSGACALTRAGDKERALDLVELAVSHGYEHLDKMENDASLDSIKNEPRFIAAFEKVKNQKGQTKTIIKKKQLDEFFFGHYKKPDLLNTLEAYEKKWPNFWVDLGFEIFYDQHYCTTPLDVIPFASTGSDGIHFGFLTDFGHVKDLNLAPIVCVAPSDFIYGKLVAKNLKDFLSLAATVGQVEFLNQDYKNENEVTTRLQEWDDEQREEYEEVIQDRSELIRVLKDELHIEPMPQVVHYIKNLRAARKKEISIKTEDGIGIIYRDKKSEIKTFDYKINDGIKVKKYLEKASLPERLKFYRDATNCYILNEEYEAEIQKTLVYFLNKDGFQREAKILKEKY